MSVLFAREGAGVAVADLDRASAEETAELCAREGADTVAIEADAADEAAVGRMLAAGERRRSAGSTASSSTSAWAPASACRARASRTGTACWP